MNGLDAFSDLSDPKKLKAILQTRAAELFKMCDTEEKGFINKKDIQRMREPLGLSPDQLEEVFDSLDIDQNGFLTLDEFTAGFSNYIGFQIDEQNNNEPQSYEEHSYGHMNTIDEEECEDDIVFKETMDSLGASNIIDGESNVKELWLRLRKEDHNMLKSFENFIGNVCQEIKKSKLDFNILESALQNKSNVYDENVRKLYEEMEAQIKAEKARIVQQEKIKEKELKEKLEKNLIEKEKQLQDSLSKQVEMEQKLFKLNLLEFQQKQENERLQKEKAMLEEQLQEKVKSLQDSKSYISSLVQQTKEEKKIRAQQTLKVTENIAIERESLVKELEMLKEINKKLQDERDELQLQTASKDINRRESDFHPKTRKRLTKQGSILSKYLRPSSLSLEMDDMPFNPIQMVSADDYSEDEAITAVEQFQKLHNANLQQQILQKKSRNSSSDTDDNFSSSTSNIDNCIYKNCVNSNLKIVFMHNNDLRKLRYMSHDCFPNQIDAPSSQREQPIGANSSVNNFSEMFNVPANIAPQRVFKIVFIGDSGVGKTSFVQRFCNNSFRESFSTTIGVDFQVKSIMIDNRVIALQLWDTAGQERYRSITKQYFRKADGVICMYDVTSEQSFKNLRNWITSMRESASDDCLLTIIGNKIDLYEREEDRVVKYKDGAHLADEQGALFFETSSKQSKNVLETMEAIARILQEKEDKQIEDVLNLKEKEKKKGCCS